MKKIMIAALIMCSSLLFSSCMLSGPSGTGKSGYDSTRFEILKTSDNVELNIKEMCRIKVGNGDGEVLCKKIPGEDYCPSNVSFSENKDIFVTDRLGSKVERYSNGGKYISTVRLNVDEKPGAQLTYAVYSKGSIYAIFDQSSLYRFDLEGNGTCISGNGDYLMLDVSQRDGRVIVFGSGSTQYISEDGKLLAEDGFKNVEIQTDPDNFRKTASVRYNRDGVDETYKINTNYEVNYVGIIDGCLVIQDHDGPNRVFTAYGHEGNDVFSFISITKQNDLSPAKAACEYGGKLYILICGEDFTTLTEVSVNKK